MNTQQKPGYKISQQAFVDKHMPSGMFTEEYLMLRWEWMREMNPSKELIKALNKAYTFTEACRQYHPERYTGVPIPLAYPLGLRVPKYPRK